jgi:hypothetical protein
MGSAYAAPVHARNGLAHVVTELTELVGGTPDRWRRISSAARCNASTCLATENTMETRRPDPNAELHSRERLRVVFALGSLLLGLLTAFQF